MNLTQSTSLLLSGSLSLSSGLPALARGNGAQNSQNRPADTAIPSEDLHPSWPLPPKAPDGAPNVVLILVDDVGFGTTGAFGGPISTPNFDSLSASGLR